MFAVYISRMLKEFLSDRNQGESQKRVSEEERKHLCLLWRRMAALAAGGACRVGQLGLSPHGQLVAAVSVSTAESVPVNRNRALFGTSTHLQALQHF